MSWYSRTQGFTLVELMISVVLGLVVSLGVIQVMVSNRVTNEFNTTLAEVQESGRFVLSRLKRDLLETGLYDSVTADIAAGVDIVAEEAFIRNNPVALSTQFPNNLDLGSINGPDSSSDDLVINLQAEEDCNGASYGVAAGEQQHIVNRLYVARDELRCEGYSGRVLRGVVPGAADPSGTVVLMDGVQSFQVQYGISSGTTNNRDRAVRYVTADQLALVQANNQFVVSIRLGVLLQSSDRAAAAPIRTFKVLDVSDVEISNGHYGQVFSHTVALRNVKNYVRSL